RQSTSRNSGWSRWWQSTSNSSVLLEPPYAEPHVRWCERAEGVTPHPTRSHQDLQSVIRCHVAAFAHFQGVPREILYDQMKTAVLSSGGEGPIVYNASLVALASHYGFRPKACQPYRAQTKGKVERPFRTIRQDFFLGRTFRNLADLNAQLAQWLMEVANARVHGTTNRMVLKAFAQEQSTLQPLPAGAYQATLKLERRISHDGMVSVEGNLYSVPDSTRRRVVEVHILPDEIHILEENRLVATHPVLEGHRQRSLLPGHRQAYTKTLRIRAEPDPAGFLQDSGGRVVRRSLAFYAAIAQYLAKGERT
ncbi:MAG: IS21 family transposase, partial [Pseudomonadota bacterium]|nr:IS21 family transposase [Pseudomonadota bacterium]